jgi:hypothetical protein
MRQRLWLVLVLMLGGCYGSHTRPEPGPEPVPIPIPAPDAGPVVDADGDGYPFWEDCDDHDASIHPGATEWECGLDGIDQNCDGFDYDEECEADPTCIEWLCNG